MLSNIAQLLPALTLLLAAQALPAPWTRPVAGEVGAKCTANSHHHRAGWQGEPATRIVVIRKSTPSELQILSYGP